MVKRYDYCINEAGGACWASMEEDPEGEYVLYEDAASLQSERDALAAEVEGLRAKLKAATACLAQLSTTYGKSAGEMRDIAFNATRTTGGEGHE